MICAVIKGPTIDEAMGQIQRSLGKADLVELRLDLFSEFKQDSLFDLRARFKIPMIFTLRSRLQGGFYSEQEEERLKTINSLAALQPEYLDLESHVPCEFIKHIGSSYPKIKLILSQHDFSTTPHDIDLEKQYLKLQKTGAHFYKIAVKANSSLDALRFLCWAKEAGNDLIAVSMGEYGEMSRIIAPIINSPITYACLDQEDPVAPGQLSLEVLEMQYRFRTLSENTALYGLIGDPVDLSVSDKSHNAVFEAFGIDAVYLKIRLPKTDIAAFLELAKTLPFKGFSVTMPLKESVMDCLDEIDPEAKKIGAVNTIVQDNGKWIGSNTDGKGALNAIENKLPVNGKSVVMIGAGGAARAIAYEALQRGAILTIVNRDSAKGKKLADELKAIFIDLKDVNDGFLMEYDILINTTPDPMPIPINAIIPGSCIMDIKTRPRDTLLLCHAKEKGCIRIAGYQMFIEQAIGQFKRWFQNLPATEQEYRTELLKTVPNLCRVHS